MRTFVKTSIRKWICEAHPGLVPVLRTLVPPKGQGVGSEGGGGLKEAIVAVSLLNDGKANNCSHEDEEKRLRELASGAQNKWPGCVRGVEFAPSLAIDHHQLYQKRGPAIHLHLDGEAFVQNTIDTFVHATENFGQSLRDSTQEPSQNVLVEYSSPNIAKPFHFGHFRSTILGNYISNLYAFLGHNVTRINYLGDWGTQFGLLSLGYELYGNQDKLLENACKHLLEVYIRVNAECDKEPSLREAAKERFCSLENKSSPELLLQWTRFREYSVENYKAVYSRMGMSFDEIHGESMYSAASEMVISKLHSLGLLESLEDGAKIASLRGAAGVDYDGLKTKVPLIKADGSTLYLTRDIAAAVHRMDRFKFNKMFYVVENAQTDHFVNLKNVLRQMGYGWEKSIEHIKFGRIIGMSTRKGTAVLLEDILDEAKQRALEGMKATSTTKVPTEEQEAVADTLGLSALLVNDFRSSRTSHYKFNWGSVLQQKGDSGIALQYAHARLYNLEKNCGHSLDTSRPIDMGAIINNEDALRLILSISNLDAVLVQSYAEAEPSFMVSYLFRLSHAVNKAFRTLPVKHCESDEARNTRLLLFRAARNVLAKGMTLLGIRPLNQI